MNARSWAEVSRNGGLVLYLGNVVKGVDGAPRGFESMLAAVYHNILVS